MNPQHLLRLLLGSAILSGSTAFGADLIYEGFDYDAGALAGQSGGTGFTSNWAGTNTALVVGSPGMNCAAFPARPVTVRSR